MWAGSFEQECRARGIRLTAQRLAVYRAVASDTGHAGAEAVYRRIRPRMPSMSLATVYRALEFLVAEGLIRRLGATAEIGRYDARVDPHQHAVCRVCRQIIDLDAGTLPDVPVPAAPVPGFRVESIDLRIVGICGNCLRKPPFKGGKRRP